MNTRKIDDILTNLDPSLEHSLKCALASIHKIKRDNFFDALLAKNSEKTELFDAHYIVYSNFNNVKSSTFLDKRGARLISGNFIDTDLTYEEIDFDIDYLDLTSGHPFKDLTASLSFSSFKF